MIMPGIIDMLMVKLGVIDFCVETRVLLQAIELVGRLRCDALTSQLLDYLMGEMDQGVERGPKYLFQLHTILGNYDQATKAALLIAHQEQVQYY
jgi:hypothetical protein